MIGKERFTYGVKPQIKEKLKNRQKKKKRNRKERNRGSVNIYECSIVNRFPFPAGLCMFPWPLVVCFTLGWGWTLTCP